MIKFEGVEKSKLIKKVIKTVNFKFCWDFVIFKRILSKETKSTFL